MKKGAKITGRILSVAAIAFIAATILYFRFIAFRGWLLGVAEVALVFVGGFVCTFLHIVIHELGHYFGGKSAGFTFAEFRMGFLDVKKVDGKNRLYLNKLKNYGGLCEMIPPPNINKEEAAKYVAGGLIASTVVTVLFLAFSVLPYLIEVNNVVYLLFCSGLPVSIYLLFNNMTDGVSGNALTDGAYLRSLSDNSLEGAALIAVMRYQGALSRGVRPKDYPIEEIKKIPVLRDDSPESAVIASSLYSYYLDCNDAENIIRQSKKIEDCLNYTAYLYREELLADVLFTESYLKGNGDYAKKIFEEIKNKKEKDASFERALAAYYLTSEKDLLKAEQSLNCAKEKLDGMIMSGLIPMEKELIEKLSKDLEKAKAEK